MARSHQDPTIPSGLEPLICNMQSRQSLLIGSTQASVGPEAGEGLPHLPFVCVLCGPIGSKNYAHKGDLTRHIKTVHGLPSRFLCHVDRCPRSIPGAGFARKDKLVDHLKTSKPGHALGHQDAVYQASLHNMSRSQVAPPAPSPSALSIVSAYPSGPLSSISQENFVQVQQAALNDSPYGSTTQLFVPYGTTLREATVPAGWHGHPNVSDLAIHSSPSVTTAARSYSLNMPAKGTMDPSAFEHIFNENGFDQDTFGQAFLEDAVDQGTFDAISLEDADAHALPNHDVFYAEDYPAWH